MVWTPGRRPVAATVGLNVRVRRQEMGLTLAEMSRRMTELGYPMNYKRLGEAERQGVNEHSRTRPEIRIDVDFLAALATVLECTVEELMTTGEPETGLTAGTAVTSRWSVSATYATSVRRALGVQENDVRGNDVVNRVVREVVSTRDRELRLLRNRLSLASNLAGLRL